eukprot:scaffold27027_cov23-Tisochrysis_lutea.AAC.1
MGELNEHLCMPSEALNQEDEAQKREAKLGHRPQCCLSAALVGRACLLGRSLICSQMLCSTGQKRAPALFEPAGPSTDFGCATKPRSDLDTEQHRQGIPCLCALRVQLQAGGRGHAGEGLLGISASQSASLPSYNACSHGKEVHASNNVTLSPRPAPHAWVHQKPMGA